MQISFPFMSLTNGAPFALLEGESRRVGPSDSFLEEPSSSSSGSFRVVGATAPPSHNQKRPSPLPLRRGPVASPAVAFVHSEFVRESAEPELPTLVPKLGRLASEDRRLQRSSPSPVAEKARESIFARFSRGRGVDAGERGWRDLTDTTFGCCDIPCSGSPSAVPVLSTELTPSSLHSAARKSSSNPDMIEGMNE